MARLTSFSRFLVFGLLILFLGMIPGCKLMMGYWDEQEITCATVSDKERITKSTGESTTSYYLIFTDKGEFKVEDDLFRGIFNSSTTYGKLRKDSTYTFTVSGKRIPWMSAYQNVITTPKLCGQ